MLRAVLLALWLVAAVASWWSAPRSASYDEAKAAVAGGRMTAYQWGDSWEPDSPRPWFDGPTLHSRDTSGPIFAWRTGDGRVHWTDTNDYDQVGLTGTVDQDNYSGAGAAAIAQDLLATGMEHRAGDVDDPSPWTFGAGGALALAFLVIVVAGPAPALGTRWFWFWLTCTAPHGLGLVFWLLRDRPWSRTGPRARKVGGAEPRDRGFLGLLIGILASCLIGALLAALNHGLGDQWVPQGSGR